MRERFVVEHLEIKQQLINELLPSNQHLKTLLKELNKIVPTDLNVEIEQLISANFPIEKLYAGDLSQICSTTTVPATLER